MREAARSALTIALTFLGTTPLFASPAEACAPAPREGQVVRIVDEEALIAFDAASKTEHFVRRATFRSTGTDFGFLVPTPSVPELGEVDDAIFDRLAQRLRAEVVVKKVGFDVRLGALLLATRSAAVAPTAQASAVRVLAEDRVAGLDAAVLEADDANALAKWLADHGYASGPTLSRWLAPYVAQKWKVTAFKIGSATSAGASERARADAARQLATKAVRMSFHTDVAFYPYREPEDQREAMPAAFANDARTARSLRVYFIGDERVEGSLGEKGGAWPGVTKVAESSDPGLVASFGLPAFEPSHRWLTAFEDASSPRPGTDEVFFRTAADPKPLPVPPIVVEEPRVITIPIEVFPLLLVGGLVVWALRRKRSPNTV